MSIPGLQLASLHLDLYLWPRKIAQKFAQPSSASSQTPLARFRRRWRRLRRAPGRLGGFRRGAGQETQVRSVHVATGCTDRRLLLSICVSTLLRYRDTTHHRA